MSSIPTSPRSLVAPNRWPQWPRQSLKTGELEAALHWVELGLASQPDHPELLQARLDALNQLLDRAYKQGSNYSETGWLKSRIDATEAALD